MAKKTAPAGLKSDIDTAGDEILRLDRQLCFALYTCSKEIIRKYKPLLDPLGLTYTGYITMLALWEEDGVTIKDLGSRLTLDSGTLTPLLKKLEALGYVRRSRSSTDERNVYVDLTKQGKELKQRAMHIPRDLICSTNLNIENAAQLLAGLHRLMDEISVDIETENQDLHRD